MASTNTPVNTISTKDNRIVKLYNDYDSNIDGYLTLDDFLKFYRDNAENKPSVVWDNLLHVKIGNDLKP